MRRHVSDRTPLIIVLASVALLCLGLRIPESGAGFNRVDFARLPVLNGGRIKPIDSIARTSLLMLSGKQTTTSHGRTITAIEWLMDVMFRPAIAATYPVFQIDDPDVLGLMGMQQDRRLFSFDELQPHLNEIETQATQAQQMKPELRSRYQTAIETLEERLTLYQKLKNTLEVEGTDNALGLVQDFEKKLGTAIAAHLKSSAHNADSLNALKAPLERYRFLAQAAEFYPLPTYLQRSDQADWVSVGQGMIGSVVSSPGTIPPGVYAYASLGDAYRAADADTFNQRLAEFHSWLETQVPSELSRCRYESIFNYFEPFYKSMLLYLTVFLLAFLSRLVWHKSLDRSAYALLFLAFAVHTVGLVSRMYLQGRPPVTNLYSSAIFVGWVAVLLGIILESWYRNGIGSMVSSTIGCLTLLIAHHLTSDGDTLEMMRAVLDSNFWLATHVTCITIGYSSTYLSGFLATLYIIRQTFDRGWNDRLAKSLEGMVYGVVCFSLFFSFVGTILGGIWADQSWGRFWGWDPKENGALMIVLWNSFLLHARWGGIARQRSLMTLVVFGNIVTSFSWFGVNMLGIGLHSYGFMAKTFTWLMIFTASQLAIMGLGLLPDEILHRITTGNSFRR